MAECEVRELKATADFWQKGTGASKVYEFPARVGKKGATYTKAMKWGTVGLNVTRMGTVVGLLTTVGLLAGEYYIDRWLNAYDYEQEDEMGTITCEKIYENVYAPSQGQAVPSPIGALWDRGGLKTYTLGYETDTNAAYYFLQSWISTKYQGQMEAEHSYNDDWRYWSACYVRDDLETIRVVVFFPQPGGQGAVTFYELYDQVREVEQYEIADQYEFDLQFDRYYQFTYGANKAALERVEPHYNEWVENGAYVTTSTPIVNNLKESDLNSVKTQLDAGIPTALANAVESMDTSAYTDPYNDSTYGQQYNAVVDALENANISINVEGSQGTAIDYDAMADAVQEGVEASDVEESEIPETPDYLDPEAGYLPEKSSIATIIDGYMNTINNLEIFDIFNNVDISSSGSCTMNIALPSSLGGGSVNASFCGWADGLTMLGVLLLAFTKIYWLVWLFRG